MTARAQPAPRRGRRPAGEDTRGAIVACARTEFAARGYEAASLRSIARAAAVDPALVHHYFTDKADLFAAALEIPASPREIVDRVLAGGPSGVGERLVRAFFSVWDSPPGRERLVAVLRSAASHEDAARMVREFLTRELFGRVSHALGGPDPELRASLAAAQMLGVALARYVVHIEPVTSADPEQLVVWLGPTLQSYLAPPEIFTEALAHPPAREINSADDEKPL